MKRSIAIIILDLLLLTSCSSTTPIAQAESITVQYTSASIPWLPSLYDCADANLVTAEQRAGDLQNPQTVGLAIRIGQPKKLTSSAYQIGSDEILVIINPKNPVHSLNAEQVRGLFSGQILNWQEINASDAPVQVWVFASSEDVQQIFEQTILGGSPVTSSARQASSPDEMVQAIAGDANAVGILTRHWKTGNVSDVYTVATVPVLALTVNDPPGVVKELLACLQK
jgi:hypothetical protein